MRISKMLGNSHATPVEAKTVSDLAKSATAFAYSLATFKNKHRTIENFEQTEAIGLDFDDGMSLDEAKEKFVRFKHIIMTTKSHRIEKNGKVADRFRVILFLSVPITDAETYYATWSKLSTAFPACDPSCKDPSRQFFKSIHVVSMKDEGTTISSVKPTERPKLEVVKAPEGVRGELNGRTCKFLIKGAPAGQRHAELVQAAFNFKQNGYTKDEFTVKMQQMIASGGSWSGPDLNAKDVKEINDIFDKREPKHSADVKQSAFSFMPIGELLDKKVSVDWVIDKLLTAGGMSLVAGPPKSGKSTMVRQLTVDILRGGTFLGRTCKQGSVLYLALEEQLEVLQEDFKRLGVNSDDKLSIHVGSANTQNPIGELHQALLALRPLVCVIDTLFLFAPVKSDKDYQEVNNMLKKIRDAARESGTHIVMLHHTRKPSDGERGGANTILGSTAIHGAVDTAIILSQSNEARYVSSSQRVGRKIHYRMLVFDEKTHTVTLGPEVQDDF